MQVNIERKYRDNNVNVAMLAAADVVKRLNELRINAIHIKIRARGGTDTKTPGPGAQAALRALARFGMNFYKGFC